MSETYVVLSAKSTFLNVVGTCSKGELPPQMTQFNRVGRFRKLSYASSSDNSTKCIFDDTASDIGPDEHYTEELYYPVDLKKQDDGASTPYSQEATDGEDGYMNIHQTFVDMGPVDTTPPLIFYVGTGLCGKETPQADEMDDSTLTPRFGSDTGKAVTEKLAKPESGNSDASTTAPSSTASSSVTPVTSVEPQPLANWFSTIRSRLHLSSKFMQDATNDAKRKDNTQEQQKMPVKIWYHTGKGGNNTRTIHQYGKNYGFQSAGNNTQMNHQYRAQHQHPYQQGPFGYQAFTWGHDINEHASYYNQTRYNNGPRFPTVMQVENNMMNSADCANRYNRRPQYQRKLPPAAETVQQHSENSTKKESTTNQYQRKLPPVAETVQQHSENPTKKENSTNQYQRKPPPVLETVQQHSENLTKESAANQYYQYQRKLSPIAETVQQRSENPTKKESTTKFRSMCWADIVDSDESPSPKRVAENAAQPSLSLRRTKSYSNFSFIDGDRVSATRDTNKFIFR